MPPLSKIHDHDRVDMECSGLSSWKSSSAEPFEYPSGLNVSALEFEGCWAPDEEPSAAATSNRSGRRIAKESRNHGTNSTLLDDIILCRISSLLLAPSFLEGSERSRRSKQADASGDGEFMATSCTVTQDGASSDIDEESHPAVLSVLYDTALVLPSLLPQRRGGACFAAEKSGPFVRISNQLPFSLPDRESGVRPPKSNSVASFLAQVGIEEVETLNQNPSGPTSGQCQFACVAMALTRGSSVKLASPFRPDLELRQLALHTISSNPSLYEDFLLTADVGRRTRSAARVSGEVGGRGVELGSYLRAMASPSCDGDAVTLQALCDALKITIRVVKPVKASVYQEVKQREKVNAAMQKCATSMIVETVDTEEMFACSSYSSLSWSNESSSEDECNSVTSTCASESASTMVSSWSPADPGQSVSDIERRRLYVSQELQPRYLPSIDSRVRDVQRITQGRLLWLSHVGDEAHYRFLRLSDCSKAEAAPCGDLCSDNLSQVALSCKGRFSLSEIRVAQSVNRHRRARLCDVCRLDDGYTRCVTSSSLQYTGNRRCGLCFKELTFTGYLENLDDESACWEVSPSSCSHEFCAWCLLPWARDVCKACPVCRAQFSAIVNARTGAILGTTEKKESDMNVTEISAASDISGSVVHNERYVDSSSEETIADEDDSSISSKDTATCTKADIVISMGRGGNSLPPLQVPSHRTPKKSNCRSVPVMGDAEVGSIADKADMDASQKVQFCVSASVESTVRETPHGECVADACRDIFPGRINEFRAHDHSHLEAPSKSGGIVSVDSYLAYAPDLSLHAGDDLLDRMQKQASRVVGAELSTETNFLQQLLLIAKKRMRDFRDDQVRVDNGDALNFVVGLRQFFNQMGSCSHATMHLLLEGDLLLAFRLILTPHVASRRCSQHLQKALLDAKNRKLAEECARLCLAIEGVCDGHQGRPKAQEKELITRSHLTCSAGLPRLLLWYLSAECRADVSSERRSSLSCIRTLLEVWSRRFGIQDDCGQLGFGRFRTTLDVCSSSKARKSCNSHSSGGKTELSGRQSTGGSTQVNASKRGRKRKELSESSNPVVSGVRKTRDKGMAKKKKKKKAVKPLVLPQKTIAPLIVRAPGKRQIRPVESTNISREHLMLRTYSGAV